MSDSFLYRNENIGQSKSETACRVAQTMNKDLKVEALKLRVSQENGQIFNDEFWEGLDAVTNAVDNVRARLFVDSRCVFYEKHLFESGTLGTKCNTQVIIPRETQSYGDSQDPDEENIPLCTLKNFPYQIEHTIQWARDYFEGIFVDGPKEYQKYTENPVKYLQDASRELKQQQSQLRSKVIHLIFDKNLINYSLKLWTRSLSKLPMPLMKAVSNSPETYSRYHFTFYVSS